MGMDISLHLIDANGNFIEKDIFNGRNYEWFGNLRGVHNDREYNCLPRKYGLPPIESVNPSTYKYFEDCLNDYCFDANYMTVKDFKTWFEKYQPYLHAGWVSHYDAWLFHNKGLTPEEVFKSLADMQSDKDAIFLEYTDDYDCSKWLYDKLVKDIIPNDAYIVYYFDC